MLTEKDYCDYETCVALKKLGFNQYNSIRYYAGVGGVKLWDFDGEPNYKEGELIALNDLYDVPRDGNEVAAPSLYEAQKWLREEKRLHIEVFFSLMDDKRQLHYDWHIVHNIRFDDDEYTYDCDVLDSMGSYKSYEEALSEGIKSAVKILKDKQ